MHRIIGRSRLRLPVMFRTTTLLLVLPWFASLCVAEEPSKVSATDLAKAEFFEAKIRPILAKHCYECHSTDSKKLGGELLLDSRAGTRNGGESGAVLDLKHPELSPILEAMRYEGLEMPPSGKLPDDVIANFESWIRNGAVDPRESVKRSSADSDHENIDIEAGRNFWSFQRPRLHRKPVVENSRWPIRKIDHFVLKKLEQRVINPAEPAPRHELLRRVTFDLTGLPPTREEAEEFLNDNSGEAYRRVVDRLLASPQFGARWARLWLDIARYGEDQAHIVGDNKSLFYPNAWMYRDWLIQAFNSDMPYDRFVMLQLAADLIEEDDKNYVAMGFLGLGPKYYRRNAPEVMADEWEDRVDTVSRGLQGLTVACARCHDHKYDPIPTEDYYALAGVFASSEMYNRPFGDWQPTEEKKKPDPDQTTHILRDAKAKDLKVHIRGDAFNEGKLVARRFLQVTHNEPIPLSEGSGRLPLAEAIASEDNPLTARVFVNRIWAQYFGTGLVSTPSNFGQLGSRPTHPELLDDLAVRFMQNGWSMKWLHREIVLSATYQQSSEATKQKLTDDPANELLARMSRRRLSVEMWRDAMLSVAGQLDEQVGGTSLDVQSPTEVRRTVYAQVSRLELNAMLQMFDYPDPNVHSAIRVETTTPMQKLFALNNPFVVRRAEELAHRLSNEGSDTAKLVDSAYSLLFTRLPTDQEKSLAMAFLTGGDRDRLQQYCQILLASNEMIFLD